MPSVPVNLVSSPNLIPSQVVDLSVSLTLTVYKDISVKLDDVLSNLIPAIPTHVDLEPNVQSLVMAMPSVDANQVSSQTLIQFPDVNLSVCGILIAKEDSSAKIRDVLRNLIHAIPHLVDLEPNVQ